MLYRWLLVVFLTLLLQSFVSGCSGHSRPRRPPTQQQTQQPAEIQLNKSGLFCPQEEVGSIESYGIFLWPKTLVEKRATLDCPYNKESNATRECYFLSEAASGGSAWQPVNATECKFQDTRSKDIFLLAEKLVDANNVVEITQQLESLSVVDQNSTLQAGDINNIASILENIAAVKEKANEILHNFFNTIDNVLDAKLENVLKSQQEKNSSSRIVETINNFAKSLVIGPEGKLESVKRNFDINLQMVQGQNFSGLNFSGISRRSKESERKGLNDSITSNLPPSITIPQTILNGLNATAIKIFGNATAIFVLYRDTKYFRVSLTDTTRNISRLNSLVIAGSIKGLSVSNLSVPVYIALTMIEPGETKSTLCSYWDFNISDWSTDGCKFERVLEDGRVLCSCDHFTNFAMLMDVIPGKSTVHDKILGAVSYVGCALSLIGLSLTIITILLLRDLRTKAPSQILLNFCIALSLTIIVFLAAAERSNTTSLAGCRTAAIALHYFLLATFFWMAVEAYNMYRGFVIVFTDSHPSKFITKCCLLAWGTPGLIVVITMIASINKYGDETYCRLHGVSFIVAFLIPTVLILVGNIVAYCFIIRSLLTSGNKVTSDRKKTGFLQAKQGIAIMVLLGLTWLFGILAIGDAKLGFQYLFCIFNTLQGLFVFFFFVAFSSGTRRQLKNLVKREIASQNREVQPKKKKTGFHLNNMVYSNNNTATTGTSESKSSNENLDNPVVLTFWKKPNDSHSGRPKKHVDAGSPKISSQKRQKK